MRRQGLKDATKIERDGRQQKYTILARKTKPNSPEEEPEQDRIQSFRGDDCRVLILRRANTGGLVSGGILHSRERPGMDEAR